MSMCFHPRFCLSQGKNNPLPVKIPTETSFFSKSSSDISLNTLPIARGSGIGVIGGVSANDTLSFAKRLKSLQPEEGSSPPIILCSDPALSKDISFFSAKNGRVKADHASIVENLRRKRAFLENSGVSCVVMPCHVSHSWHDDIKEGCSVPFLHVGECVAKELKAANLKPLETGSPLRIGVLASNETPVPRIYQEKLENEGFEVVFLDKATVEHTMIPALETLNRKDSEGAQNLFKIALQVLLMRAVNRVVLASDHLEQLLPPSDPLWRKCIDPMDSLARLSLEHARCPETVHRVPKMRRAWQLREEEVLLDCLKELVATGWKSDNGFRAGYVNKLEELLRGHFPAANIRANPHIVSKLTGWKKNYSSLCSILGRSGVGFNLYGDYTVEAADEQWEQICNVDANAKNIRGKAWPYYDRWAEAFGKDRATGETAEDVIDAVNELLNEEQHPMPHPVPHPMAAQPPPFAANSPTPTATFDADTTDNSEVNSTRFEAGSSRSHKKRKLVDETDQNLCDILGKMHSDTKLSLDSIAHRIGYQSDLGNKRTEIWLMLDDIPHLGMEEKFDVSDILIADPLMLEFFSGLPILARAGYVHRLLMGKGA